MFSFYLLYIYMYVTIQIYHVSQKWVHPSHFCRYLSITLHETTLTKWHSDTMKSSLGVAYITELIYFPLKITQNITINIYIYIYIYKWSNWSVTANFKSASSKPNEKLISRVLLPQKYIYKRSIKEISSRWFFIQQMDMPHRQ